MIVLNGAKNTVLITFSYGCTLPPSDIDIKTFMGLQILS